MKLHEYQAKGIFASYGIPTPNGQVANNPAEVATIAEKLSDRVVVKAQVHVGGRGKAGGVKVVEKSQAKGVSEQMFGMDLKGLTVHQLLVEQAINIGQEYYLGITLDRAKHKPVIMFSAAGGVDIEEVAAHTPEKILRVWIDPQAGLQDYQIRQLLFDAEFPAELMGQAASIIRKLTNIYFDKDCSLAEVNPFVITKDGQVIAADGKIDIDENAAYRQAELVELAGDAESSPLEIKAKEAGLSFVELEGDIGCVVNGAGLAMATMDLVKFAGGQPANFLDIGGSSNPQKVTAAMEILMANPDLKAILFNIFGGITRCDDVANGLLTALKQMDVKVPIVIRLTGTNEEKAREILTAAGFPVGSSMMEAVHEVIRQAKGAAVAVS